MTTQVSIKQGCTIQGDLAFTADDDTPIDLTGCTVTAQVRDATGQWVADLPVTLQPVLGIGVVHIASTAAWPLGVLRCDVRVTTPLGDTVQTETFALHLMRSVTHA